MSDLISRDALLKDLNENYVFYGFAPLLDDFTKAIQEQPPVDAEPVRHGHWEQYNPFAKPICSVCGEPCFGLHGFDYKTTAYCPNCGAKMYEEES